MKYPEFREELLIVIKNMVSKEVTVRIVQTEKLNGCVRYGVLFDRADLRYTPTIYLEPFYRSFLNGKSLENIATELLQCYEEEINDVPKSVERLQNYDSARMNIFCKLIHMKENQRLLQNTPHITFLDFAIVAYFEVDSDEMYKGSVLIQDYYLDRWHITAEELIQNALASTREKKGIFFRPMSDILYRYIGEEEGELYEHARNGMFVLTNTEKYLGAVLIYYPEVLEQIAAWVKEDFYLLPSSVHEWIIVPVSMTVGDDALLKTVRDINRIAVLEEEVLSDNIYLYSIAAKGGKIRCITGTSAESV